MKATMAKKLLRFFRVIYYMIRKGVICKKKLMLDLQLLLKRSKIAGKAIANIISFDNYISAAASSDISFYNEHEAESSFGTNKHKDRNCVNIQHGYENSPATNEEEMVDERVDKEAEEFIKRFYEQLRIQQRSAMTPMHEF